MLRTGKALIIDADVDFGNLLYAQLVALHFEPGLVAPATLQYDAQVWQSFADVHWLFVDLPVLISYLSRLLSYPRLRLVAMGWDNEIQDSLSRDAPTVIYLDKALAKSVNLLAQTLDP